MPDSTHTRENIDGRRAPNHASAEELLDAQIHTAVMRALTEPDSLSARRASIGDCAFGALAAGASQEAALQTALNIHSDPLLANQIPRVGGLMLGASTYLGELG